jgi:hypothetical protein
LNMARVRTATKPTRAPKPKSNTAQAKPRTTKPKATAATKPKPFGYDGSLAQKMDTALLAGGTWEEIAKQAGVKPGLVRSHGKFRSAKGKYNLIVDGDQVRLVYVEA